MKIQHTPRERIIFVENIKTCLCAFFLSHSFTNNLIIILHNFFLLPVLSEKGMSEKMNSNIFHYVQHSENNVRRNFREREKKNQIIKIISGKNHECLFSVWTISYIIYFYINFTAKKTHLIYTKTYILKKIVMNL